MKSPFKMQGFPEHETSDVSENQPVQSMFDAMVGSGVTKEQYNAAVNAMQGKNPVENYDEFADNLRQAGATDVPDSINMLGEENK